MGNTSHETQLVVKKYEPSQRIKTAAVALSAIGLLGLLIGFIQNPDRLWTSYLTAFFFVSCLALGGLFWAVINNIANAGWSVSIRRLSEGMSSFLPVMLIGALVLIAGLKKLYPWADPEVIANNSMVAAKTGYLNVTFLVIRILIFGCGTLFFAKKIVGNSLKQDENGDEQLTHKNVAWSIAYVIFFALAFSLFSVDLLMSLLPTWYSTIFGIYCFAGLFQSSLAFLILMMIYMRRTGNIQGYYTMDHFHDLGKYLKGFTVFWAYIAFSQFMLIWYANIPEETEFFLLRAGGGWMVISMSLLFLKFIVPFLALLPKAAKRNEAHLIAVSSLILVMQYVDIYWMVYPNFNDNHVVFGFYEIALLCGFVGVFLLGMIRFFSKNNLVAIRDPRMHEATHHHVSY